MKPYTAENNNKLNSRDPINQVAPRVTKIKTEVNHNTFPIPQ